jgi:hypothetical protein
MYGGANRRRLRGKSDVHHERAQQHWPFPRLPAWPKAALH